MKGSKVGVKGLYLQPPVTFFSFYQIFIKSIREVDIFNCNSDFHNQSLLFHNLIFKCPILSLLISTSYYIKKKNAAFLLFKMRITTIRISVKILNEILNK